MAGTSGAASSSAGLASLQSCIEVVREAIGWPEQFPDVPRDYEYLRRELQVHLAELEELSVSCRISVLSKSGCERISLHSSKVKDSLMRIRIYLQNRGHRTYPSELYKLDVHVRANIKELVNVLQSLKENAEKDRLQARNEGRDYFVPGNHAVMDGSDVVLNFESRGEHGERRTFEGQLLDAMLATDGSKTVTACARGFGGVGKTCALRGVAQHLEVEKRFWGGVYYGTLGQDARKEQLRETIIKMVKSSGGTRKAVEMSALEDFQNFVVSAGQWFAAFPCLFLIDDVWLGDGFGARDFELVRNLARHPLSRVAFTTRDATLKADKKIYFEHREREGEDSRQILLKTAGFESEPKLPNAAKAFEELLRIGNGLPLKLALIGGGVRKVADVYSMSNSGEAWVIYCEAGSDKLVNVKDIAMRSLSFLDRDSPDGMHHRRFKSLSVLRYAQRVTISVASRMWGLSKAESKAEAELLGRYHIVRLSGSESGQPKNCKITVSLHDDMLRVARDEAGRDDYFSLSAQRLVYSYLRNAQGVISEAVSLSFALDHSVSDSLIGLDTRGMVCAVGAPLEETSRDVEISDPVEDLSLCFERWPTVEDDGYFYENLCWLLSCGKLYSLLTSLISEPQWLIRQLCARGVGQALGDLDIVSHVFAQDSDTPAVNALQRCMKLMKSTIIASKLDLISCEWDGMPWFQLHGRLSHFVGSSDWVREYVGKIERLAPRPWYKPSVGCLLPASLSLLETISVGGFSECVALVDNTVSVIYQLKCYDIILQKNKLSRTADCERVVLCNSEFEELRKAGLSEDGKTVVLCMQSGDILLYSADAVAQSHLQQTETAEVALNQASPSNVRNAVKRGNKSSKKRKRCDGESQSCLKYVGKQKDVEHVALSRNGETIVSGSEYGGVRVWKMSDGEWKETALKGHTGSLECVAASADGTLIVSGGEDRTMQVYEMSNGNWTSTTLEGHTHVVRCVSVSGDGSVVVSGSQDKTVRVWNLRNGERKCTKRFGLGDMITCVSVSMDGMQVVAGCFDGAVHVLKMKDGDWDSIRLVGHTDEVCCVSFSADGTQIVSGSTDRILRVYNAGNGEWARTEQENRENEVYCVSVSAYGMQVVSGFQDGMVQVWNKRVGEWKCTVLDVHTDSVSCVSVSPNGELFVSSSFDGTLRVWTMREGEWESIVLEEHNNRVYCVSLSADGSQIVSGCSDLSLRVWKTRNGEWERIVLYGHLKKVNCVAMSADGSVIVSGGYDRVVVVWKERDGDWKRIALQGHSKMVDYVSISADGMQIVSEDGDKCTITWNFVDEEWVQTTKSDVPRRSVTTNTDNIAYGRIPFSSEMKFPLNEIFRVVAPAEIFYAHRSYFFLREYYPYFSRIDEMS